MSDDTVQRAGFGGRLAHWAAELLLVFLGAYAAFWLSNYQERRQEEQRHGQILISLEHEVSEALANAKTARDSQRKQLAEFHRALAAGEMPALQPLSFASDYSPTDIAALLQAGGYHLLDVRTLFAIREAESTLRGGISTMTHLQKLSDELIMPNLEEDVFYDPVTKQLRKRFAVFVAATDNLMQFFDNYIKAEADLLSSLRAEQDRLSPGHRR